MRFWECEDCQAFENFTVEAAAASRRGFKSLDNQDALLFLASEDPEVGVCCFGVFDGCGGTQGGGEAARICAELFGELPARAAGVRLGDRPRLFASLLEEANAAVHRRQLENPSMGNMACTATVAWLWEDPADAGFLHGYLLHVGDSRAYLLTDRRMGTLTSDHGVGHILTKVVGVRPEAFHYDERPLKIRTDRVLLFATDGLWKPCAVPNLESIVRDHWRQPAVVVRHWMEASRNLGSDDDQTAVAVLID